MPPKKDSGADGAPAELIKGFETRECKLLAAAFLSSTAADKYDYELMATLTGNTNGSLKKMWPPVKRKAADLHESFAKFLGTGIGGEATAAATPKKRKTADSPDGDAKDEPKFPEAKTETKKKAPAKEKAAPKEKVPPKPRAKKVKTEAKSDLEVAESSADGGDGADPNKELDEEI